MDDNRQGHSGAVRAFARSAEAADGVEEVKLIHVPLFLPVNFGQLIQSLIRQLYVRNLIENRPEDLACFIRVSSTMGEHTAEEFRAYDDF